MNKKVRKTFATLLPSKFVVIILSHSDFTFLPVIENTFIDRFDRCEMNEELLNFVDMMGSFRIRLRYCK